MPRDYCRDAYAFGQRADAEFHIPAGGSHLDRDIARLQHELVLAWQSNGRRPSTGELRDRYKISKQVMSRVATGRRWAGETVLAILMLAKRQQPGTD